LLEFRLYPVSVSVRDPAGPSREPPGRRL